MSTHFGLLDGVIIVAYLAALTGIGVYFSRRQTSLEHFFLADRRMGWLPIGLSLMAALNSGIDYIGMPGTTLKFGVIFVVTALSWFFIYPWAAYVMLPFYRRLKIISVYEYLEHRFDVRVRTLAASIFLLWRIGWMATALYVPCLAIDTVTGGRLPLVPLVVVLGTVVTLYTMLGGIQAVIWTDVLQFCVMFLGVAVTVIVIVSNVDGGVAAIWNVSNAAGKIQFSKAMPAMDGGALAQVAAFLRDPDTFTGILVSTIVGRMSVYTTDQVMMQRFQTTRSLAGSRSAFVVNSVGDAVWTVSLTFVGLSLFAFYQHNTLPAAVSANTDQIFPYFMSTVFPTGVIGLVIAAILAASLSSIDSAINSCTSVVMVDFYNRLWLRRRDGAARLSPDDQRSQVRVSRLATLLFGIVAILLATQVSKIGMVIRIGNTVIQTFTGPLLGIYMLGMFSGRSRSAGVLAGGVAGTAASLYVAFGTSIGFMWPTVAGLLTTVIVGFAASLAVSGGASVSALGYTWRSVMRLPLPEDLEK